MRTILIQNRSNPTSNPISATYCDTFLCRFRGLMFRPQIKNGTGLLLDEKNEGQTTSAIHMLFMRFDICVIWINSNFEVIDTKLAKQWASIYIPSAPARYILETHTDHFSDFRTGDQLEFKDA